MVDDGCPFVVDENFEDSVKATTGFYARKLRKLIQRSNKEEVEFILRQKMDLCTRLRLNWRS
jgi:hypothetical protein